MYINKKRFRKCLLGLLTMGVVCSGALGIHFTFAEEQSLVAEDKTPITSPRYVYDTSLNDAVLGVGSTIALPKATIENTLSDEDKVSAAVTIIWNGNVVEGYNEAETYADDFTFSNVGKYEITYSYADSEATPKDVYTITVKESAPVITAVERTPYIVPVGTELTEPQVTATYNGNAVDSEVNVYFPDETAYRFKTMTVEESGKYELEFKTVLEDTVYSYVKTVYAYGTNAQFTGNQTPYYGAPSFEKELQTMESYKQNNLSWTDGLNVSFSKGSVFSYDKPIRLSEMGSTDKFIQFYSKPTGKVSMYFYVDLVDANDENNVLSVRFCSVPTAAGSNSYYTYASTAATGIGQVFAGRKDSNTIYVDRLSAGTYFSVDISGVQDTHKYQPLSFAYDETTKQVYTGGKSDLLVADLDDTETYFANAWSAKGQIVGGQKGYYSQAWDGFSSDEVYVRMRVEGDYVGLADVVITKIGNHDLKPKFASMLPEPTVRHTASWITSEIDGADYTSYYGATSFADEILGMTNYNATAWGNGINATLKTADVFHYPDLVDLSKLSATDEVFKILLNPTGEVATTLYVDLIDENDSENILSVRFNSFNTENATNPKYRTYVTAAALKIGQPYTGVYNGTALHYNRPNGGYYLSTDLSGLNTVLYNSLNFAYDETTKQVLIGSGIVADMDDTTTHFDSVLTSAGQVQGGQTGHFTMAWEGFSSNKVYLQVRAEGLTSALDTAILKIGTEDLSKYEAKSFDSAVEYGDYSFDGEKAPYYGAPTFADELDSMSNYNGESGINVSLGKSDVFSYNAKIDLSTLSANDNIFKILLKPTGEVTTTLYVDLIDENDSENILSVRFNSFNTQNAANPKYRTYVTAAALKIGQPYTGVQGTALYYNRPNGGYYLSTDLSGLNTVLYNSLNFAYDETTKQVLIGSGIVADMDDTTTHFDSVWTSAGQVQGGQTGYFTTAWEGFSSDKVYLRVRADGMFEETLDVCILSIGADDVSKTGASQTNIVSNAVKIDFKDYKETDLPKAIVGKTYSLFPYSAYDVTGKVLAVKTKIYYGDTGVQIANDGVAFIPTKAGKYTVMHTVTDRYGYTESKSYVVWAVPGGDVSELTIETEETEMITTTGLKATLPAYYVTGGNGIATTTVELYFDGELIKTFGKNELLSFIPVKNGDYTVKYIAVDYVGSKAVKTVTVTAQPQDNPIFEDEVTLSAVLIDGWTYELPELYAMDYTGNEPKRLKAQVTVYDARNGYVLESNSYTPSVSETQTVRIVYSVETENGYDEKVYTVQVQKVQGENGLRIEEYFTGNNVSIAATQTSVCVTAQTSGASVGFVNPLIISENGLILGFNVPQNANAFDSLNIYLTDSDDSENKVKLTLYKGSAAEENDAAFTTLKINDGTIEYKVPGSFLNGKAYELIYEETYRWITASNGVKATIEKTVNGKPFEGFSGRFVYVTFEFGTVLGTNASINISKINNQQINSSITVDKTEPQIAILGEYGGMAEIRKEVSVASAIAGDVLSQNASVTVTVTGPSAVGTIVSKDGIELKNADGGREYVFTPTHYGTYRVTFTAECNGYKATKSYNISVPDNDGPSISVNGEIPSSLKLNNGETVLSIPDITVTDESAGECRTVINLKRPDGTMIRLEENEIVLTAAGKYVLYVSAYDKNGNQTVQSFDIWVS